MQTVTENGLPDFGILDCVTPNEAPDALGPGAAGDFPAALPHQERDRDLDVLGESGLMGGAAEPRLGGSSVAPSSDEGGWE